ncbi:MAG: tetratricopeptide repeat protein [Chloroflexota bacterium]
MDSLYAFIPMDRRLAMARGETLPDRTTGAVLFADISGFTPLTAALVQELGAQRGAEEVLNKINPVYEALIAELHQYGGSVMGFAGDSITCWLDGDNGHRAVACALAMQEAMKPFATVLTPAGMPITLAIKVAVAVGPARRFIVGRPDIQLIDVLAGVTLDHVASAEKHAEKGEVVLHESAVHPLDNLLQIVEWRIDDEKGDQFAVVNGLMQLPDPKPYPPIPSEALAEEELRPWTLPPVYERLHSGSRFLAELRPSVSLFPRFSGIDYDNDEDAGTKLDAYVRWQQEVLARHEGYLIQLTIGDKGSYMYASFGAPVAHDDDAERAVAASLELRDMPAHLDYIDPVQIGLSSGRVWAGECGAAIRHTYGVMGNEVNMAARLMGKATPGEIIVRSRIAEATGHSYRFRQLGFMTVKGRVEPVPVAELLDKVEGSTGQASLYEAPLVGRETELQQLDYFLDLGLTGQGQIMVISGPAGVGKSHLAAELRQHAAANGYQVAIATNQRTSQSTAYYPWQQLLHQIFGLFVAPPSDQSREDFQVEQALLLESTLTSMHPSWAIRLPLLKDILGLPIPDNPTTAAFDPKQRQEALLAFIIEIIRNWSGSQPLMLVVDNVHWMDEASRNLLEGLASDIADVPIVLLLTVRPELENEDGSLSSLADSFESNRIELHGLSLDAVGQQLENLLGGSVSLIARLLIQAKSQGNPFFVRELTDSLRESQQLVQTGGEWGLSESLISSLRAANALVYEGGIWVVAPSADLNAVSLGIPDSVHGVILARIDRLPEAHKPTLKVASVVGFSFELGLVAQVHPARPSDEVLGKQMELLDHRDFVTRDRELERPTHSLIYAFRQQVTQEVSYETLLYTQRRELHCTLANVLLQEMPDAIEQIAYHAFLGEDWRLALRHQLLAGRRSKALFANLQSIDHYSKALTSAEHLLPEDTLTERQEIYAALGELQINTGQLEASTENLEMALRLAKDMQDADAEAEACRWIARGFEMRGEYDSALEWIDSGLGALGERLAPASLEMRLLAGLINARQGNYRDARQQALASLLAASELGAVTIVARSHSLIGHLDRLRGNTDSALEHLQEALDLYREAENLSGQATVLNLLANIYFDSGDWKKSEDFYRQAGQIFNQLGDAYNRSFVDNNRGGIALNQGRLDEALDFYERALKTQERIGKSPYVMGLLHLNLGATQVKRGEQSDALYHLNASQELFDQAQARDFLPELYRRFAEANIAIEELDAARDYIQKSEEIATELAMKGEIGHALRVIGRIELMAQNSQRAEEALLEAVEILEGVSDEYGVAQAHLLLAQLYAAQGDAEQSLAHLEEAEPLLQLLGAERDLEAARELRGTATSKL